jgi:hypothetical protein
MGSSDSKPAGTALVSLVLGGKVDATELNALECVQLLHAYMELLQPAHKFLPAISAQEITSRVRPLKEKIDDLPLDHVFYNPVKYDGVGKREKCVDLDMSFGFIDVAQRDANEESHRHLYWTRSGKLAVLIRYYSLDVAGTVAYDFVALSEAMLCQAFSVGDDSDTLRINRKMWLNIIKSMYRICEKMVISREEEAAKKRTLLNTVSPVINNIVLCPEPVRLTSW